MIDFISANNGKIEMYNDGNFVATAETAKTIAYVLEMYGFENYDDAKTLWGEGVKRFYMTNEVN